MRFLRGFTGRRAAFRIGVVTTLAIAVAANVAVLGNLGAMFGHVVAGARYQNILVPHFESLSTTTAISDWGVPRPFYDRLATRVGSRGVIGLYESENADLGKEGGRTLHYLHVTPSVASVFGIQAATGRLLMKADMQPNAAPVMVVSSRFAHRLFGTGKQALGHYLKLDGINRRIVGVLPPDFLFPQNKAAEAWVPFLPEKQANEGLDTSAQALVRPFPSLSRQALRTALKAAYDATLSSDPNIPAFVKSQQLEPQVTTLARHLYGSVEDQLEPVEIAALLLALLIFVNLCGLAAADAIACRHELSLRAALGADTPRLYRERFREYAVLALLGWALGTGLGWLAQGPLAGALDQAGPDATLSLPVLAITLAFALATAILLSTFGFWRHRGIPLSSNILGSGARSTGGRTFTRTLRVLISVQLAIGVVLLIVATHLRTNVSTMSNHDLGFSPAHRYFFHVDLPYPTGGNPADTFQAFSEHSRALDKRLQGKLASTPGIEAAAMLTSVLHWGGLTTMTGSKKPLPKHPYGGQNVEIQSVTNGIVAAAGLHVIAGDPGAVFRSTSKTTFIDSVLGKRFWPDKTPGEIIGRSLYINNKAYEITGVIAPIRVNPYGRQIGSVFIRSTKDNFSDAFVVHSTLPGNALRREIIQIARKINPQASVSGFRSGREIIEKTYRRRDNLAHVLGALAVVAALIAAVGLFALLSYRSLARRPEFAIRATFGATPGRLLGSVISEAFALWLVGCLVGVPAAYVLLLVFDSHLPSLGLPAAWIAVAVVTALAAATFVAAIAPARRAARVTVNSMLSV